MDKDDNLTLKHYKEPLLAIPKKEGFGYYGALIVTKDGTKCQCHICGNLYASVGVHAYQAHGHITSREYKEKFKLSPTTALVSETERLARQNRTIAWIKKMQAQYGETWRNKFIETGRKGREKRGTGQPKESLESKNKKGTCPDQLLDKIHQVAKKIGHTPSLFEFINETGGQRYKHLIFVTFGSWKNAIRMAKLQPHQKKENGGRRSYTDEQLFEYLCIFTQENGRIPTFTDFRRGLLPSYDSYTRRFGTIENAREKAGVYQFISK